MTWTEQESAGFALAMGESFADAVCPPVPFATAFGEWFASSPPSVVQIREAVEATLARWPS